MPSREQRARKLGLPIDELPDGRGRHGRHARGATHPRWAGGITTSDHGYIRVQVGAAHPLADPNGYAYLHVLVWASVHGLPAPGDLVHHEDEDKLNNRLENLQKTSRAAHGAHHIRGRERDARGRLLAKG
jgi:hypothetical protein